MRAMASSNFLVCWLHTGVSSEGTTLNMRALAGVLPSLNISRPVTQAKSGALSPGLSCGPARLYIVSLNLTWRAMVCLRDKSLHCSRLSQGMERRLGFQLCANSYNDERC